MWSKPVEFWEFIVGGVGLFLTLLGVAYKQGGRQERLKTDIEGLQEKVSELPIYRTAEQCEQRHTACRAHFTAELGHGEKTFERLEKVIEKNETINRQRFDDILKAIMELKK